MAEFMTGLKRSHYCGDLRITDVDKEVTVCGWVRTIRASNAFGFIELNDGSFFKNVQIVFTDALSNFEEVKKLNLSLGIPASFKEQGIDEQEFLAKVDMLADRAFEDQCTSANPRVPLIPEIKQILLDAYYGNKII